MTTVLIFHFQNLNKMWIEFTFKLLNRCMHIFVSILKTIGIAAISKETQVSFLKSIHLFICMADSYCLNPLSRNIIPIELHLSIVLINIRTKMKPIKFNFTNHFKLKRLLWTLFDSSATLSQLLYSLSVVRVHRVYEDDIYCIK